MMRKWWEKTRAFFASLPKSEAFIYCKHLQTTSSKSWTLTWTWNRTKSPDQTNCHSKIFKDIQKRSQKLKTFLGRHAVLCSRWFQDFIKAVCGSVSTSTVAIISSDFCLQSGSFLNPQVRRVQRSRSHGICQAVTCSLHNDQSRVDSLFIICVIHYNLQISNS